VTKKQPKPGESTSTTPVTHSPPQLPPIGTVKHDNGEIDVWIPLPDKPR